MPPSQELLASTDRHLARRIAVHHPLTDRPAAETMRGRASRKDRRNIAMKQASSGKKHGLFWPLVLSNVAPPGRLSPCEWMALRLQRLRYARVVVARARTPHAARCAHFHCKTRTKNTICGSQLLYSCACSPAGGATENLRVWLFSRLVVSEHSPVTGWAPVSAAEQWLR